MKKTFATTFLFLAGLIQAPFLCAQESRPVVLLEVRGTIDPPVVRYVTRALGEARLAQASAAVIQLDTSGSLDGSTREIVRAILDSPVPVIIYVAPQGARAINAGLLIAMAAHVAAMAPDTRIGAARPPLSDDASAYLRSVADLRDRNRDWVEASVRKSHSSSAEEAKAKGGVDLIAKDLDDLLAQSEGWRVNTPFGATTLLFKGRSRQRIGMSLAEKALHQLARPALGYALLLLGICGLLYELARPAAVFPGVVGAILLALGLAALEISAVHWGGLAVIGLSVLVIVLASKGFRRR